MDKTLGENEQTRGEKEGGQGVGKQSRICTSKYENKFLKNKVRGRNSI